MKLKRRERSTILYSIITVLVIVCLGAIIIRDLRASLFFQKTDRVNMVFYGKNTTYYSLGVNNNVDYSIPFYPDLKIQVPGGYGLYRIGGIGKLVGLFKSPDIFRKTFSMTTSTFLNLYFYSNTSDVYYGKNLIENTSVPDFNSIFFSKSNATFFDRVFVFLLFSKKRSQDFNHINDLKTDEKQGDKIFAEDYFINKYQGYFYSKFYRDEKKNIQILYMKDYGSAERIGRILDGSGIRVSDISQENSEVKKCIVTESSKQFSVTAHAIASFFSCDLKTGPTDIYDIIFELGDREKEWE